MATPAKTILNVQIELPGDLDAAVTLERIEHLLGPLVKITKATTATVTETALRW